MTTVTDAPCAANIVAAAVARVPATCGELLQGVDDQGPILVSLPVDRWGSVDVALTRDEQVIVTPDLPRARDAVHVALDRAGWTGGAAIRLGGEVPQARGMGSSTVDVAGVIGAVLCAADIPLDRADLVALMTLVEPSDTSPLPGLWAIDHVGGRRALQLGPMPQDWWLAVVDSGVRVRTQNMHRWWGAGPQLPPDVVAATNWNDARDLAGVATQSAIRNQDRLPHTHFDRTHRVATRVGAPGICVAHSGSLCAVICDGMAQAIRAQQALAAEGIPTELLRACAPGMQVRRRSTEGGLVPQRDSSKETRGSAHV